MKMSQIDTQNDKPKIFKVFKILCIFSTDFAGWNVEKGQQGKNVLSSMLFRSLLQFFFLVKMSQIDTDDDKKPKFFQYSMF